MLCKSKLMILFEQKSSLGLELRHDSAFTPLYLRTASDTMFASLYNLQNPLLVRLSQSTTNPCKRDSLTSHRHRGYLDSTSYITFPHLATTPIKPSLLHALPAEPRLAIYHAIIDDATFVFEKPQKPTAVETFPYRLPSTPYLHESSGFILSCQ